MLGEAQVPLPRLPRALVSAGVVGEREGECWAARGPGAGGCGRGRATFGADAASGLCCFSCSVTCFRKHKGKAPGPRLSPGPSPRAGQPPYPTCSLGDMDPSGRAPSGPSRAPSCRGPLPMNVFPDFKQKPFFCSAFLRTILFSSLKIVYHFREKSLPAFFVLVFRRSSSPFGRTGDG